jgi:mitotic spindle assembly checkpoint protein MAD1
VKSKFMMAPDTVEKQVQEYQAKLVALEEQLSKQCMCWFTIMRTV